MIPHFCHLRLCLAVAFYLLLIQWNRMPSSRNPLNYFSMKDNAFDLTVAGVIEPVEADSVQPVESVDLFSLLNLWEFVHLMVWGIVHLLCLDSVPQASVLRSLNLLFGGRWFLLPVWLDCFRLETLRSQGWHMSSIKKQSTKNPATLPSCHIKINNDSGKVEMIKLAIRIFW